MKRLICFELKKIFSRKLVLGGLLLVLLLGLNSFPWASPADIQYEQQIAAKYAGSLDDAKVRQMLSDFLPSKEDLERWHGVSVAYIGLNSMQSAVHSRFANPDGTWNGKTVADVYGDQRIQVGYHSGWLALSRSLVQTMTAAAFLTIVMTASVFSGEYAGADNILLTSRYGKTRCPVAKIIASFAASLSLTALILGAFMAAALFLYGTTGLDSSVLFCEAAYMDYIPFNISCGTMLLYQIGLSFSGIAALTALTLLVSAVSRNATAALAITAALFLLPLYLSPAEHDPLFRLAALLPVYQLQFSPLMSIAWTGKNLLYAVTAFPASAAFALAGAFLSHSCFSLRQVR